MLARKLAENFFAAPEADGWVGFARLEATVERISNSDDFPVPVEVRMLSPPKKSHGSPAYIDSSGRQWGLLSQEYVESECSSGLLSVSPGTSLVQRKRSKNDKERQIKLDNDYLDLPYTPELYESACHILGPGATWRVHTRGGYHRVRLHLVDWWHWPAKNDGARRQFEIWLHDVGGTGATPEKHTVFSPTKGYSKVLEFFVHLEPVSGLLDIEIRCTENAVGDPQPCFSAFEVVKVPREDIAAGYRRSLDSVKTEFLKEALDDPKKIRLMDCKKTKQRSFGSWIPKLW